MSLNKNDLQAIGELLDIKLAPMQSDINTLKSDVGSLKSEMAGVKDRLDSLESDMRYVKVDLLENNVIPRLSTIESCYVSTSNRYIENSDRFDAAINDIKVMKIAIMKNSEDIQILKKKQA